MTFSSKVKDELSRTEISDERSAKAEAAAFVRTVGYITIKGLNKVEFEFLTENAAVARRIFKVLKAAHNINAAVSVSKSNRLKKQNNYIIKINEKLTRQFLEETRMIEDNDLNIMNFNYKVPEDFIDSDLCKRAYIKGSFMGDLLSRPRMGTWVFRYGLHPLQRTLCSHQPLLRWHFLLLFLLPFHLHRKRIF